MVTIHRKAYTRKDGTRVKATSYQTGEPGKQAGRQTGQKPFDPRTKTGWPRESQAEVTRARVREASHGEKFKASVAEQYPADFRKS
jgi:hypothetical protein